MKSLKWKLIIIYLALVFIVMVIAGTYIVVTIENSEFEKAKGQLEKFSQRIYDQVVDGQDEQLFGDILTQMAQNSSTGIQGNILDENGNTLASTLSQKSPPNFNNSAIIKAMAGSASFASGKWAADITGALKEWLSYAEPISSSGKNYIIFSQMDIIEINDNLSKTKQTIVISVAIALIFTCLIGIIFANTITSPIITLAKKAKDIARGKLSAEIAVKSNDEIGQLTRNFNYMSQELNNTMRTISSEKNKLETLLHNMTDGVLAFDHKGLLLHANAKSKELLQLDDKTINFASINELFEINDDQIKDFTRNKVIKLTAFIDDKYIGGSFAAFANERGENEGIVIVIDDITEQKKLDNLRKEFVANVSHEIRTPLTTIKTYTETLIDGALDDRETALEFLNTIDHETDRMTLLATDLLQLSKMDSKRLSLDIKSVNLNEILLANVKTCKPIAIEKKQRIVYYPCDESIYVDIDYDRFTQVITNIITNSLKYSNEATKVKVSTNEDDEYYKIIIEDQGIGIPKEDIGRIFERFYRVDKTRSRAMGGTGLGLAIAKEIMLTHRGDITVSSKLNEGTIMTVLVPKNTFHDTVI